MRREGGGPPIPPRPEDQLDAEHYQTIQKERRRRLIKLLVALFVAVVLIVFIVTNVDRVPVDFVFFTRKARLIWVMLTCAVLGGIVGYLVGRPGKQIRFHRRDESEKQKK
jgi:uncharacterized integral membrane protein